MQKGEGREGENKVVKDMEQVITKQQAYEGIADVHYLYFLIFKVVFLCHVFHSCSSVRIAFHMKHVPVCTYAIQPSTWRTICSHGSIQTHDNTHF